MREDGTRASHVTIIRLSHRHVQSLTLMVWCESTKSHAHGVVQHVYGKSRRGARLQLDTVRAEEVVDYNWIATPVDAYLSSNSQIWVSS
jgi:hypothetical protein